MVTTPLTQRLARLFQGKPRRRIALLLAILLIVGVAVSIITFVNGTKPWDTAAPPVSQAPSASEAMDTLKQQVAAAVTTPLEGDAAQQSFQKLGSDLLTAHNAGADPATVEQTMDEAEVGALSTDSGTRSLLTTSTALNGTVLQFTPHGVVLGNTPAPASTPTGSPPPAPPAPTLGLQGMGPGGSLAVRQAAVEDASSDSGIPVIYFVNGVNNTYLAAANGAALLYRTLSEAAGSPIPTMKFIYNFSVTEHFLGNPEPCFKGLMGSRFPGVETLRRLCGKFYASAANLPSQAVPVAIYQPFNQWVGEPPPANDPVGEKVRQQLLSGVQQDIEAHLRVVMVSHSQGGFFLREALTKLQQWWTGEYRAKTDLGCPSDQPPVAALYIAPPFPSPRDVRAGVDPDLNKGFTRYVMLKGDFLTVIPTPYGGPISMVNPTSTPSPPQTDADSGLLGANVLGVRQFRGFFVHQLDNYLSPGSESQGQVKSWYAELAGYVNGLQGVDDPCSVQVTAVHPDQLGNSETAVYIMTGKGFTANSTINVCKPGGSPCVPVNSLTFVDETSLTAELNGQGTDPGDYDLVVTTPTAAGPIQGACQGCLHVVAQQPSPTESSPSSPSSETPTPTSPSPTSLDLSGPWTMRWNWSVTDVYFVGTVTGGAGQYTFHGTLDHGGNAIWTPAKGSLSADCAMSGEPADTTTPAGMSCTVTLPDGVWIGQSQGTLQLVSYDLKNMFEYLGTGQGTNQKGELAHMDHLDLSPGTG